MDGRTETSERIQLASRGVFRCLEKIRRWRYCVCVCLRKCVYCKRGGVWGWGLVGMSVVELVRPFASSHDFISLTDDLWLHITGPAAWALRR